MVQTCVVHLIRASMRFVSYKDRKSVATALKRVYSAPNEETAREALEDFAASDLGARYPQTGSSELSVGDRVLVGGCG